MSFLDSLSVSKPCTPGHWLFQMQEEVEARYKIGTVRRMVHWTFLFFMLVREPSRYPLCPRFVVFYVFLKNISNSGVFSGISIVFFPVRTLIITLWSNRNFLETIASFLIRFETCSLDEFQNLTILFTTILSQLVEETIIRNKIIESK